MSVGWRRLAVCFSVFMLYVVWKRGLLWKFAPFVLFFPLKQRSFNHVIQSQENSDYTVNFGSSAPNHTNINPIFEERSWVGGRMLALDPSNSVHLRHMFEPSFCPAFLFLCIGQFLQGHVKQSKLQSASFWHTQFQLESSEWQYIINDCMCPR